MKKCTGWDPLVTGELSKSPERTSISATVKMVVRCGGCAWTRTLTDRDAKDRFVLSLNVDALNVEHNASCAEPVKRRACPICGRMTALTLDGKIRTHRNVNDDDNVNITDDRRRTCKGTGRSE